MTVFARGGVALHRVFIAAIPSSRNAGACPNFVMTHPGFSTRDRKRNGERSNPRAAILTLTAALALHSFACDSRPAGPRALPSEEDLYAYSLAVAERARDLVGEDRAIAEYYIGKVHARFGLEDLALAAYEKVVEVEPYLADVHRDIAFILSQRKDRMNDALREYQRSLLYDDSQSGVRTRIGMLLLHLDELDGAKTTLLEEISRGSADEVTWLHLGQVQSLKGSFDDAAESFRHALEIRPGMRESLYGLARALRAAGKNDEAERVEEEFRAIKEKEDALELEARANRNDVETQRRNTALTWVDAAQLFLGEAEHADALGRDRWNGEAANAFREALRFDSKLPAAYLFLTQWYQARGDRDRALAAAREGVAAVPDDPWIRFELARLLVSDLPSGASGQNLPAAGEAIDHLRRVLEVAPDSSATHTELARVILFYKRVPSLIPEAYEHAERGLALAKEPQPYHYDFLAMASFYSGRTEKALTTLREGCRRFPEHAGLRQRLEKLEKEAK